MDIKTFTLISLLFLFTPIAFSGAPSFVIQVNEPDGSTRNVTLTADQMAQMQDALRRNDMNTVNSIIDSIPRKPKVVKTRPPKRKIAKIKQFTPEEGYYKAQETEQRVANEDIPAFSDPEQYTAQQTKLKLSSACEKRLLHLKQKFDSVSKDKLRRLRRYINAYTKQCEVEAKKLVDSRK